MSLYRDQAVILRTYKLGEADRIVVMLTEGRGKVRAVAKGVRRTKSRFGSRLEPASNVSVLVYEGRELDIVSQAETLEPFRAVREDLDRMTDAMALLEAVDQVAQEGGAAPQLYRMLVGALRRLADERAPLLVAGFYWKLLSLEGAHPLLDDCAVCGRPTGVVELVAFDLGQGGALCRSCRRGRPISAAALEMIRRILRGELAAVLREPAGSLTAEVSDHATWALEEHLERRLRVVRLGDRLPPALRGPTVPGPAADQPAGEVVSQR